jgi:predicted amidohydrolase
MKLKIALVQMRSEKGAIAENLKAMSVIISEADKKDIEIICFPEASITGYVNPIKYPQAVISADGEEVEALCSMTQGHRPIVLAGLIEKNPAGKPFITQLVVSDGKIIGLYRKKSSGTKKT